MTLFSIITITKNNSSGLLQTCKSIRKQSLNDYEWIVIDGGNKDDIDQFEKPLPYDFYLNEPDNGIYGAMNKGITQASGTYTLFLNAGDILASDDTLKTISQHITPDIDFIYGDSWEYTRGKNHYKKARDHSLAKLGMLTHHQAMLYKTTLIKDMRYSQTYIIASDYDFTLRFLQKAKSVKYLPTTLCIYQAGGLSQTHAPLGRKEQFEIRKNLKICGAFENRKILMLQKCNEIFRKKFPVLYWRFKSRTLR